MMSTGKCLTTFLKLASLNSNMQQSHLSLYSAILLSYIKSNYNNPFPVSRRELMKYSAIHSIATYHRCIKEMVEYKFIVYQPSYHPGKRSQITLPNV